MDAFKSREIEQMRLGGNKPWRDFFDDAETNKMAGITWDDATIAERYSGDVGEEWKDRLAAKVEGKDYVPGEKKEKASTNFGGAPLSSTASRSGTPIGGRTESPSRGPGGKAKVDDRYFAGLGAANASRPADLPPSQGGKYAGFGSSPMEPPKSAAGPGLPGFDDLQKDPLQALSKGFGWFTSTVGKTAKTVNEGYIQPTAAKVGSPSDSPISYPSPVRTRESTPIAYNSTRSFTPTSTSRLSTPIESIPTNHFESSWRKPT